jgi:hypothetical protein
MKIILQYAVQFVKECFTCPFGWEDETGFNYGFPPEDEKVELSETVESILEQAYICGHRPRPTE